MPQLSIIIPVYNAEKTLDRVINSVINQSFDEWELFLIDDGSSDNSGIMCDMFAVSYKNIYCFHQENQGVSSARNVGISKANGKYLAFLDADDWIESDYYCKMISFLESNNTEFVISGYIREFWKNGICRKKMTVSDSTCRLLDIDYDLPSFITQDYSYNLFIHVWNKLYLRSIIEFEQLFFQKELYFAEDVVFNLNYFRRIKKLGIISYHGYHYICQNEQSMTSRWLPDLIIYNCNTYKSLKSFLQEKKSTAGLHVIENMYLRGCILNMEKAMLAKQSYKQLVDMARQIKQAPETQEILKDTFFSKKESIEFIMYRILFKAFPNYLFPLAVYARLFMKRILKRL